ncbi:MAG: RluA family pseudouridine synthase [Lachnospiraceae bacterium]|nr:RluA family pseudouridine synthase [Lachnospiraceae bacterium]
MNRYDFLIDETTEGERLDKGLSLITDDSISRSFIQKLIKDKRVYVNQTPQKASYTLKNGDEVAFETDDPLECNVEPQDIPLDILYEDSDVIVINKPKNMVVHPAPGHMSDTMVNALLFHCKGSLSGINGVLRPGIVHRIDKDTTGSVIVCKNDASHRSIAEQLKEHSINRRYRAIVHGNLKQDEGTIESLIGRDPKDRKKMSARVSDGKKAVTHYKVLERFKDYTYIECVLETGRTHQIRVHMAYIGHPILGDTVYSGNKNPFKIDSQCLHAYILGFISPSSGEYIETTAPLPLYFEELLEKLRTIR